MNLAGRLGFEPRQSAPKALDLPLVDRPMQQLGISSKLKTAESRIHLLQLLTTLVLANCYLLAAPSIPPSSWFSSLLPRALWRAFVGRRLRLRSLGQTCRTVSNRNQTATRSMRLRAAKHS